MFLPYACNAACTAAACRHSEIVHYWRAHRTPCAAAASRRRPPAGCRPVPEQRAALGIIGQTWTRFSCMCDERLRHRDAGGTKVVPPAGPSNANIEIGAHTRTPVHRACLHHSPRSLGHISSRRAAAIVRQGVRTAFTHHRPRLQRPSRQAHSLLNRQQEWSDRAAVAGKAQ